MTCTATRTKIHEGICSAICSAAIFFFCTSTQLAGTPPPELKKEIQTETIASLTRCGPEKKVWIRATVVSKIESDTYRIQDATGRIILFLSTDELAEFDLEPGQKIAAYGSLDISPVGMQKNEFDAEELFLAP